MAKVKASLGLVSPAQTGAQPAQRIVLAATDPFGARVGAHLADHIDDRAGRHHRCQRTTASSPLNSEAVVNY